MQEPLVMAFGLNLYVQQSPEGSFIMGRGDANEPRDLRMTSSWNFIEEMAKTIDLVLPPISKLRVIRQWAGLYCMTPDKQPIYDKADNIEGFYVAVGYSGHGFMFGPVTGIVMSEMILGEKPTIDVSMLNLNIGDKLFLYTDGITEAKNEANQQYGTDSLINAIQMEGNILNNLNTSINEYCKIHKDDYAVLMVEII